MQNMSGVADLTSRKISTARTINERDRLIKALFILPSSIHQKWKKKRRLRLCLEWNNATAYIHHSKTVKILKIQEGDVKNHLISVWFI